MIVNHIVCIYLYSFPAYISTHVSTAAVTLDILQFSMTSIKQAIKYNLIHSHSFSQLDPLMFLKFCFQLDINCIL